jgi:hypothetical protein
LKYERSENQLIYEYKNPNGFKNLRGKIILGVIALLAIIAVVVGCSIYL